MQNQKTITLPIILLVTLVVCLCCCCILSAIATMAFFFTWPSSSTRQSYLSNETPTPVVIRPGVESRSALPTPFPSATPHRLHPATPAPSPTPRPQPAPLEENPLSPVSTTSLLALENTVIPINDPVELTQRLAGSQDVPRTADSPPAPHQVGDQLTFWATNVDSDFNFQVDATLHYVTDHAYFWIDNGVEFDPDELRALAEAFEDEIYPTDRAFFGSEWTPGVDGEERIYILFSSGLGYNLAGYFSSADEYHPLVNEYSNMHEMFFLNTDNLGLGERFTYGVLAHEYQHMIHWYQDRNEASWINEGFSELAAFLNGYYEGGFDTEYAYDPDLQLTDWPNNSADTTPHYGAAFLFLSYFLDRFGEETTQALVAHPENGLASIDDILSAMGATDPATAETIQADDVVLDWMVASYVQDKSVGDGRYDYTSYADAPRFDETESYYRCPVPTQTRQVHQYGVDYIRFTCPGDYNLHFEGSIQVGVLPVDPHSGSFYFWSNKGDESHMTLTRSFDFSTHSAPLTMSYWTWYDLESDYDYLYLTASLDGENWDILITPSGTPEDPSGNNYGWGYNGSSGGRSKPRWIRESVDLSQYAGKKVTLRFEYVTDAAVNGEGFVLDDLEIPEIGYFSDFEEDDGGWQAAGWTRIENVLPQTFRLALIRYDDQTTVENITLPADLAVDIPLHIGGNVDEIILVVTGTTRFTRQPAAYHYEVQQP